MLAIVRAIKQNQAFNQKGGSVFTFNLCSLEPGAEDAYPLLALADPTPEQVRYQRIPGNTGFETSYEVQQIIVAERANGEYHITEILL